MDIVERLRKLVILDEVRSDNPLGRDAADEIERLREINIKQAKWLYDEQQAHKTLRNKVRQWLRDDKFDILKEDK